MGIGKTPAALLIGMLLSGHPQPSPAQSQTELRTWVEDSGSVPPVHQWFNCIHELEHKAYSKLKAQECLNSILSHPEFEKGSIAFNRRNHLLTFTVASPTLTLSDLDLDVPASELAKFHELLSINGEALRIGEPYDRHRESQSWFVLDLLLRAHGQRAGISRKVYLDYANKKAQVVYKIWQGPPGDPDMLVPPYAEPCPILNANFNGFDWDDFTPVEYVRHQMKTKWLGCFSEVDLREDEARLQKMSFLKESKITVSGSGNLRDFGFHFRSNPIPIAKVKVHSYGLLDNLFEADIPSLAIHPGDTYSNARVSEQEKSLTQSFQRTDSQIKVFTDVQIDSAGSATLDFSILVYPDDVVYINGKPYDVTAHLPLSAATQGSSARVSPDQSQ